MKLRCGIFSQAKKRILSLPLPRYWLRTLLLLVILLPVLGSCAPPVGNQEGNVTISLPGGGGGRAIAGEVLDNLVYVMAFSGPGGGQVRVTTLPGESSLTLTLDLGDWMVRVDAFAGGILFGSGEAGFRVRSGGNNSVPITMKTLGLSAGPFGTLADIAVWLESSELEYRGRSESDAIPLAVATDDLSISWENLLSTIGSKGKFVALDLSAYTTGDGSEFRPYSEIGYGKDKIVSLVLPDTATSIIADTTYGDNPAFKDFSALKRVAGGAVETIGDYAFDRCTSLSSVSFPEATGIGNGAFRGCTSLSSVSFPEATGIGDVAFSGCTGLGSVNLPVVTRIGNSAFEETGTGALTVTLGDTVPTLGTAMFFYINVLLENRTVTVRVPAGAGAWTGKTGTFEGAENTDGGPYWGEGFRGRGWDNGTDEYSSITSNVNPKIFLTVTAE